MEAIHTPKSLPANAASNTPIAYAAREHATAITRHVHGVNALFDGDAMGWHLTGWDAG